MDEIPLGLLFGLLGLLIVLASFFAGSETGVMTLNRYRLRHLAKSGHLGARLAEKLLEKPDRFIGAVLLGNTLVVLLAGSVATLIGLRLGHEEGVAIATGLLTIVILIFGEVAPKTLAALHPERVAFPAAFVYVPLLRVIWPLIFVINFVANNILRLFGVTPEQASAHSLSSEELRTVVAEAGALLPRRHRRMLLSILDLEKITVEDIMVPRNEIVGIDISADWEKLLQSLITNQHTRLPVYDGSIDELRGIVHMRRVLGLYVENRLNRETLLALAREPYYVPAGTPLNQQLVNFQNQKRRIGFVVNEYGDIQGLVTLEDILEEIVGDFTSDPAMRLRNIARESDGSFLVPGSMTIRSLNRATGWRLPTSGPKTLNGLIVEYLEDIPQPGTSLKLKEYTLEIAKIEANKVKAVRIRPPEASATANAAARQS